MTFGVSDGRGDFEYSSASPNGLFAKRAHLLTPWFHRMVADLARFNRAPETLLGDRAERRSSLGALARAAALLAPLHRPPDRPPGLGRVVGRPAPDVELSRPLPGRVLRQPRDARRSAAGRGGARSAAARRATSRRSSRRCATGCGCAPRSMQSARADHVLVTPRGGEAERFDEVVLATHSDQALALLATPAIASTRSSARSPISPTRRSCTPTSRCCPAAGARGRAGTTTCSTSRGPRATVTYHMNRLQSLRAEREFCVTLNRTAAIDPAQVIRTIAYAHPVYTRRGRRRRRRACGEISGATAPTSAAPTGAGASTRTASQRAARRPSADRRRAGRERELHLRGARPPPAVRAAPTRVPPPPGARLHRPRRAADGCSAAGCCARGPGLLRFRRRDYLGDPRVPLDAAVRDRRGSAAPAPRPRGRSACSPSCARAGTASTRSASTTASSRRTSTSSTCRRGHEHAVGRAPRLRARAGDGPRCSTVSFDKQLHVSPFMGMDHRYRARAAPAGATLSVHIESRAGAAACSTPRSACAAAS